MKFQAELYYLKALDAATKETGLILFVSLEAGKLIFDPAYGSRYVVYDNVVQKHVMLTDEGRAYYADGTSFPIERMGIA